MEKIVAPVKGAPRMKAKVEDWRKQAEKDAAKERKNWPHITWLGKNGDTNLEPVLPIINDILRDASFR